MLHQSSAWGPVMCGRIDRTHQPFVIEKPIMRLCKGFTPDPPPFRPPPPIFPVTAEQASLFTWRNASHVGFALQDKPRQKVQPAHGLPMKALTPFRRTPINHLVPAELPR